MPAAEDVERQIAVAIIVAVEVPALLLAVERIVGGVEVDLDAYRRLAMGVEKDIDKQPLDRRAVVIELVVPVLADLVGMLQPVQRRLPRKSATGLVEHGSECWIVAQLIVIDQVLVAQREGEDALAQQVGDGVGNAVSEPQIAETLGQPIGQPDRAVGGAKQQNTTVRRDGAAIESTHKFAPATASEVQLFLATLCRHRGASPLQSKSLQHNNSR